MLPMIKGTTDTSLEQPGVSSITSSAMPILGPDGTEPQPMVSDVSGIRAVKIQFPTICFIPSRVCL